MLKFAPELIAQQAPQPPLSEAEEVLILKALIDRDEFAIKAREYEKQLAIADEQQKLANERLRLEREQRLGEKKLHLAALLALKEYRTTRRPLIVKIFTFGIVRDKKDQALEQQITDLQMDISIWKP